MPESRVARPTAASSFTLRPATTSSPSRSTRACCSGSRRRWPRRRWTSGRRARQLDLDEYRERLQDARAAATRSCARISRKARKQAASASSSPRASTRKILQAVPDPATRGSASRSCSARGGDRASDRRAAPARRRSSGVEIIDPRRSPRPASATSSGYWKLRSAQGHRPREARTQRMRRRNYFGAMMVAAGRRRRHGHRADHELPRDHPRPRSRSSAPATGRARRRHVHDGHARTTSSSSPTAR